MTRKAIAASCSVAATTLPLTTYGKGAECIVPIGHEGGTGRLALARAVPLNIFSGRSASPPVRQLATKLGRSTLPVLTIQLILRHATQKSVPQAFGSLSMIPTWYARP